MKLLVTGCASRIAQACLPLLLDEPDIANVTGVDSKSPSFNHPHFESHLTDIHYTEVSKYFDGIDAIVHLAFISNSGSMGKQRFDRETIRHINVDGSKRVFELAAEHKVKTIIHLSSAIVYGINKDNGQFITEDQALKPVKGLYYSEDKVAVEHWLDEFEQQHPELRIVRFRPHVVLGQFTQPLVKTILNQPFYFLFNDPQPLLQCISETDVARAILLALTSDVRGSFNLATDQVASFHLIQNHQRNYPLPLPYTLAKRLHKIAWRYTGRYGDPAWFNCLQYSLTIENEKAKRELNWTPTLNLFECLDASF